MSVAGFLHLIVQQFPLQFFANLGVMIDCNAEIFEDTIRNINTIFLGQ